MPNLFYLAAVATLVLTGLSVLAIAYLEVARIFSSRRQRRAAGLIPQMRASLEEYLQGRRSAFEAAESLSADRGLALGLLLTRAARSTRAELASLYPVFGHFGFEEEQVSNLLSRSPAARARAAANMGYMNAPLANAALMHALEDPDSDVRWSAAGALAQRGATAPLLPALAKLANDPDSPSARLAELIYRLGPGASNQLKAYFTANPDLPAPLRAALMRAVTTMGESFDPAVVSSGIQDEDVNVRVSAVRALGQTHSSEALPPLKTALHDKAWEVRAAAARALADFNTTESLELLQNSLTDSSWWVRHHAAQAFGSGEEALGFLQRSATQHADPYAQQMARFRLEELNLGALPPASEVRS